MRLCYNLNRNAIVIKSLSREQLDREKKWKILAKIVKVNEHIYYVIGVRGECLKIDVYAIR